MNIGTLWAQIGLNNSLLKSGARESEQVLNQLAFNIDSKLTGAANLAKSALGLLGVAFTADYLIQQVESGIEAIDKLHLSTVKIASMIATMQGPKQVEEHYAAAKAYAAQLAVELKKVDAISFANAEGLQAMAETMIMQGVILDTNNQKQIESFAALSNMVAMYTQGQNQEMQIRQETRALMTGEARAGAVVAQQIDQMAKASGQYKNGLKDIVRLGKEHGDFWERIEPFMMGVKAAAPDIANSWEAVKSSWTTAMTEIKRNVFADVYKDAVEKGKVFVEWMKTNSATIANSIKTLIDVITTATKIAVVYFAVFKVAPAIYTAVAAAIGMFQVQMALANAEMVAGTAIGRAWALVVGTQTVSAAWAAAGAMGKLAIAGKVLMAFFIGWEIGKILSEKFEVVRQFGVALAAGLHKLWNVIVSGWEATKKAISGDFTGAKAAWATGVAERKVLDEGYGELFIEQSDWYRNQQKRPGPVKVPELPKPPKAPGKDLSAERKALEDAKLSYLQAVQDKELSMLRTANAEKLALLESERDQGLRSTKSYLDEKLRLESASIQKEIDNLKKRNTEREAAIKKLSGKKANQTTVLQERAKIEQNLTRINELEGQLKEKKIAYDNDLRKSNEGVAKSYEEIQIQLEETMGHYERAAQLKVQLEQASTERKAIDLAAQEGDAKAQALQKELTRMDELAIAKGRQQDLDAAMANKMTEYENQLNVISNLEVDYRIRAKDAALQRLQIYEKEKDTLQERQKAQETYTAEGLKAYLALTNQIEAVNQKLLEQKRILQEKSSNFAKGFTDAIKKKQDEIMSLYQLGAQTLNDFVNATESTLGAVFGDLLRGKIENIQDAFRRFGEMALDILAQILAKMTLATMMGEGGSGGWGGLFNSILGMFSGMGGGGGGAMSGIVSGAAATTMQNTGGFSLLSGLELSAKGNVYKSTPSISDYSGSVVSKPTVFAFAKGAGLMGEAGYEAILPLEKNGKGELGVKVSEDRGRGKTVQHVHNWQISALDSQSFFSYIMENRDAVAASMRSLFADNSPIRRMG